MSLLDTVEPAGWNRTRISNGEVEYFTERDWKHESLFEWEPQYSRETVESLLSQCRKEARKEAFLEAAEYCDELAKLYPREDVGFDKGYLMCATRAANELRRMAESDKTTMEGEK